ncbi:HPr(Ser) kinase/phosphatase [Clostridiales bacterium COT073_COT-073]|nr:HPr(Ser) kinase/phosphatase [Clostridiales bacterium COT073_COT-073]
MDERQHDYYVELPAIVERMKLKNMTPGVPIEEIRIYQSDLNRPALQLAGFFDYFDAERVQVIGKIEHTYIHNMFPSELREILRKLFSAHIPCMIFTRNLEIPQMILDFAVEYQVPIFQTNMATSNFNSDLNRFLKSELAPRTSIHGVLVDVYGEGVLIIGESGIGKSETALELIRRGHRLVADDVVEVKRVSDEMIIGSSPDIIRHFIELRGIGIVDCKMLFGVQSVKDENEIDMVIQLQEWQANNDFDRLGLIEEHMDILGVNVPSHTLPIRPGRNLAIIVESAAINYRQKKMGYNAAEEINRRVMGNLEKAKENNNKEKQI